MSKCKSVGNETLHLLMDKECEKRNWQQLAELELRDKSSLFSSQFALMFLLIFHFTTFFREWTRKSRNFEKKNRNAGTNSHSENQNRIYALFASISGTFLNAWIICHLGSAFIFQQNSNSITVEAVTTKALLAILQIPWSRKNFQSLFRPLSLRNTQFEAQTRINLKKANF